MQMAAPVQGGWPNSDADLGAWYADYRNWAKNSREHPFDLEDLRERLWDVARKGQTIPAGEIMNEFHLAHGDQLRAIGYVIEIVSEHNRRILGHKDVYLSSVVILKSTKGRTYREGLPLRGYFDSNPIAQVEIDEMLADRRRTQNYCRERLFERLH